MSWVKDWIRYTPDLHNTYHDITVNIFSFPWFSDHWFRVGFSISWTHYQYTPIAMLKLWFDRIECDMTLSDRADIIPFVIYDVSKETSASMTSSWWRWQCQRRKWLYKKCGNKYVTREDI